MLFYFIFFFKLCSKILSNLSTDLCIGSVGFYFFLGYKSRTAEPQVQISELSFVILIPSRIAVALGELFAPFFHIFLLFEFFKQIYPLVKRSSKCLHQLVAQFKIIRCRAIHFLVFSEINPCISVVSDSDKRTDKAFQRVMSMRDLTKLNIGSFHILNSLCFFLQLRYNSEISDGFGQLTLELIDHFKSLIISSLFVELSHLNAFFIYISSSVTHFNNSSKPTIPTDISWSSQSPSEHQVRSL